MFSLKKIPEIEVTAHHLVTTFSDGGGALSVAGLWQAKSVDQIMGESPHKLFVYLFFFPDNKLHSCDEG